MLAPTAAALLDVWERARRRPPHERSLQLLAWALPEQAPDALADFDLGLRDWHLLRLRQALFGHALAAHGECPHCGERIELQVDTRALQADTPPAAPTHRVDGAGRRYRLPNTRDLIAVARMPNPETAARALYRACCLDGTGENGDRGRERVERELSELAAQRCIRLDLRCAACGDRWLMEFDPGGFCWEEIEACAQTLLDDVHRLASAYGWSEREILALGDARRTAYLERIG